jgi:hypothetical protein
MRVLRREDGVCSTPSVRNGLMEAVRETSRACTVLKSWNEMSDSIINDGHTHLLFERIGFGRGWTMLTQNRHHHSYTPIHDLYVIQGRTERGLDTIGRKLKLYSESHGRVELGTINASDEEIE